MHAPIRFQIDRATELVLILTVKDSFKTLRELDFQLCQIIKRPSARKDQPSFCVVAVPLVEVGIYPWFRVLAHNFLGRFRSRQSSAEFEAASKTKSPARF